VTDYSNRAGRASTYIREGIFNETPLGLVARIYEIASWQIARARTAMAEGDFAAKGAAVGRVSRCLSLLQTSLDKERGGEVAHNLDRLYTYLANRLSQAHVKNDDATFAELARHLTDLGGAWRQAADTFRPVPDGLPRAAGAEWTSAP
jgi:flagellar protein FliS